MNISAVQCMKHFIYHFISILHGLIRTHKWPAPNVSGFIDQLVRASHRYREVTVSNPVEVLTFSGFYTPLLKIVFITAMIIAHLNLNMFQHLCQFLEVLEYTSVVTWTIMLLKQRLLKLSRPYRLKYNLLRNLILFVGPFNYSIVLLKNFDPTFMTRSRNLAHIISLFTLWETSTLISLNLKPVAFLTIFLLPLQSFSFVPAIDKPTRGYKNSAKLIDNIFANRIHCKSFKRQFCFWY